jgi:hypothetical protein
MWQKIKGWFKHSETIFIARLQVFLGAVVAVGSALTSDPTVSSAIQSLLDPHYIPYYIIAIGVLTEVFRRRNATDLH